MNYLQQVKTVPAHILLQEVWPNGLCLMRDDVWIAFWETDDENTEYCQETNESFEHFIWRAMADIIENEKPGHDGFLVYAVDFAIAQVNYIESQAADQVA